MSNLDIREMIDRVIGGTRDLINSSGGGCCCCCCCCCCCGDGPTAD